MNRASCCLPLTVAAIMGLSWPNASATGAAPRVLVVVDDRAEVAPRVLDQAQKEASRIFWHEGISIEWVASTESSGSVEDLAAAEGTFAGRLIIQAKLLERRGATSRFLMGAAPPTARNCGGSAYVFFDQIVGFSNTQRTDSAVVMGTVAAHELGHLLLRNRAHASEGLMRAPWRTADWRRVALGLLLFSPSEANTMRATITSCRELATSR